MDLFHFLGQSIGMAMRCDIPMELRWPSFVWKRMVGLAATESDLRAVDQSTFHFVDELLACPSEEIFAEKYSDLCFCAYTFDGTRQIDLLPGQPAVSFENRKVYCDKLLQFKLCEGAAQMDKMIQGLNTIVPACELSMYSAQQLERKICGAPCVDISILKQNTVYDAVQETAQHVQWLWQCLEEMDQEHRALFLQFVWARSRLPLVPSAMT